MTDTWAERKAGRQTDTGRQTFRQKDTQAGGKTGRQTDRHADITGINNALRQDSPELGHDVLMLVADHLGVQLSEVRHLTNRGR